MFTASAFFVNSGEGFGVVLASSEFPFSEIDDFQGLISSLFLSGDAPLLPPGFAFGPSVYGGQQFALPPPVHGYHYFLPQSVPPLVGYHGHVPIHGYGLPQFPGFGGPQGHGFL